MLFYQMAVAIKVSELTLSVNHHSTGMSNFHKFTEFRTFCSSCPLEISILTTADISGAVDVFVCCCFIDGMGVLGKVNYILSWGGGIPDSKCLLLECKT